MMSRAVTLAFRIHLGVPDMTSLFAGHDVTVTSPPVRVTRVPRKYASWRLLYRKKKQKIKIVRDRYLHYDMAVCYGDIF